LELSSSPVILILASISRYADVFERQKKDQERRRRLVFDHSIIQSPVVSYILAIGTPRSPSI